MAAVVPGMQLEHSPFSHASPRERERKQASKQAGRASKRSALLFHACRSCAISAATSNPDPNPSPHRLRPKLRFTHVHIHANTYAYAHICPPTDYFPPLQSPGDLRQTPLHERPPLYPSTSPQTTPSATAPSPQASSVLRLGASTPAKTECRAILSSTFPTSLPLLPRAKRLMA